MRIHPSSVLTPQELERYGRHLVLPEIGVEGQAALKRARVLLVGAGGLGAPAGLYLAAAGVGRITIIDDDTVDVTNLQRQVIFTTDDVGQNKAEAACARLRALNPNVDLVAHPVRLTYAGAPGFLRAHDIVLDGSDNFSTRYLVNDTCAALGIPHVHGSVLRFEGQVSLFGGDGPCYRCLFPEPPGAGTVPDCAEAGVLGVLPGMVGAIQAAEAIKLITHAGTTLAGRLLRIDALNMKFTEVAITRDPACPVCGDHRNVPPPPREAACAPSRTKENLVSNHPEITVKELKQRLDAGEKIALLDVREPNERAAGNIGGTHIPMGQIPARMNELDADAELIVYCRSGNRSSRVVEFLQDSGFEKVKNLTGGIRAWSQEIDPSVGQF